ncbi:hypothetical protein GCM10027428_17830 [Haliea atlantica]
MSVSKHFAGISKKPSQAQTIRSKQLPNRVYLQTPYLGKLDCHSGSFPRHHRRTTNFGEWPITFRNHTILGHLTS